MRFTSYLNESKKIEGFNVIERRFSDNDDYLTIGLGNIHAFLPEVDDKTNPASIEKNKLKIERAAKVFKDLGVNMAIFPEFCLAGYFWDESPSKGLDNEEQQGDPECWEYMENAVIENHGEWIDGTLKPMLDNKFQFIMFNNIRRGPERKYLNSTYVINKGMDHRNPEFTYDKILLPGIEKTYTISGQTDRLVIDTDWGRFGFTSCYDFCFSQLLQEYSQVDEVDAVIQIASWRGTGERDYDLMNVYTDTYYGDLWDMFMQSRSSTNQIWVVACNAVGVHNISKAKFWGGSGLWAPSGLKLYQASNDYDELVVIRNVDIQGLRGEEKDDFDYSLDFNKIYNRIEGKRAFTRL
jgi:predicted amidohydrolase